MEKKRDPSGMIIDEVTSSVTIRPTNAVPEVEAVEVQDEHAVVAREPVPDDEQVPEDHAVPVREPVPDDEQVLQQHAVPVGEPVPDDEQVREEHAVPVREPVPDDEQVPEGHAVPVREPVPDEEQVLEEHAVPVREPVPDEQGSAKQAYVPPLPTGQHAISKAMKVPTHGLEDSAKPSSQCHRNIIEHVILAFQTSFLPMPPTPIVWRPSLQT